MPTPHPLTNGSFWEGVGLVLLNHFSFWHTQPFLVCIEFVSEFHLCPTAALPREKSLGPVPALDCGDGYSANQRGVSSIILFGSPSELGGWLTPTSHSVGKKSCCFDRQCCCCSGLFLVVVVSFAHSPPFDQRIILGRSGFSFTKPLQFLAHTTFLGLH